MSAYCLDCGVRTTRKGDGTLVIIHKPDCPNRRITMPKCGATLSVCTCRLTGPHEVHECGDESELYDGKCMGKWRDNRQIVRFPTGATTEAEARVDYLVLAFGDHEEQEERIAEIRQRALQ